ncbi:MAG: hypothetical protein ALMCE001_16020 [Methanocorpusculum sp. MCE]|nr:MAG: hypothetical protein ALMCE001_16020 [Methanocorpusculum sp. MCE]
MGELIHTHAVTEIRRVLETAGYDCGIEEGPFNLSAVRGAKCILVMCSDDINLLQRFDMTPYTINLDGTKVRCDKIIFTGSSYFQPKESDLWSKEKLIKYIGDAAAARIWNLPFDIVGAPSYAYTNVGTRQPQIGYDLVLPVRISGQEAMRVARQQGTTVLRMIPYWYYHYKSGGEATYKGKSVSFDDEGSGWINAINDLPGQFGDVVPQEAELPQEAEVMPPVTSLDQAKERIRCDLIKKLTRRVRIKTTAGDAIFAEEKDFRPSDENIDLVFKKVYVPVWQVRGKKDIVEVNAYSGEELNLPSDEGCEVF